MSMQEQMEALLQRCSKFSGYSLSYLLEVKQGQAVLTIADFRPEKFGNSHVCLTTGIGGRILREVAGRLSWWCVTTQEQDLLLKVLRAAEAKYQ